MSYIVTQQAAQLAIFECMALNRRPSSAADDEALAKMQLPGDER